VHSPLVGPATWDGVVDVLTGLGYRCEVPDLTGTLADGPPYCTRQVEIITRGIGAGPVVLVGHSGAGALLAPAGCDADQVLGYVFVDAGLPIPGQTQLSTMPPDLAAELRAMAGPDGWLRPWPAWWGDEVIAELLPDPTVRDRFAAGCPPLPLAMFEEVQPPAPGWARKPGAYLLLSQAYAESAAEARARGWPVLERRSDHLAPVTDPGAVGAALIELVQSLPAA
jgi:Alpha/beta hydrolase family